jgi:ATP-dependent DNA ligase
VRLGEPLRLRLERDGDRVRLITRGGYNWTDRFPWIMEAARKNRVAASHFLRLAVSSNG